MASPACASAALLRAAAEYAALVASSHGWLTPRVLAPATASALAGPYGAVGALAPARNSPFATIPGCTLEQTRSCRNDPVQAELGASGQSSPWVGFGAGTSLHQLTAHPDRDQSGAHHHLKLPPPQPTLQSVSTFQTSEPQPWSGLSLRCPRGHLLSSRDGRDPLLAAESARAPREITPPCKPTGSHPNRSAAPPHGTAVGLPSPPHPAAHGPGPGPGPGSSAAAVGVAVPTRSRCGSSPPPAPAASGWPSLWLPRSCLPLRGAAWHWDGAGCRRAVSTAATAPASSSSSGRDQGRQAEAGAAVARTAAAGQEKAAVPPGFVAGGYSVASFPPERIRNFSIIAHVDHGKSTLADRLMEMTGALGGKGTHNAQYLDKLQVERERGITVKAQTVSLVYHHGGVPYLLNLIDTPGHVDFSYEVSRSLAACQGALLVVDAGQGIQAQTVANFYLAFEQGLDLVPVVNKIDLPAADPRGCAEQMAAAFDLDPDAVLFTSAKTGQGMQAVMPAVVERIRPPRGDPSAPLRMLLFDAFHDEYRGVVVLVEVVDGQVAVGQRVALASTGAVYEVMEVGLQAPERHPTGRLLTGQVGYMMCGIKDLKAARVGDTMYAAPQPGAPPAAPPPRLPGFKPAKSMVFAGLFPMGGDGQEFEALAAAMDKLLLNDASVVMRRENSEALGPGFRCGFLGMLHMEIFTQRLEQEFGATVVTTSPMVPYVLEMPDGSSFTLESAADYPLDKKVERILEPTVTATLIAPDSCLGRLLELCASRRGEQLELNTLGGGRAMLRYRLPLAELAGDFYSAVKSRSQGYASFDYEEGPYRPADLVRLDILAHGQPVDALARMVAREDAATVGRALVGKMKELLDRQQFEVVLQAAANGKIVARETLKALRKNVTAKCYGGDITRKRKLLDKQKEGKRRMKRLGSIDVPQELFPELMKTR